MNAPLLVGVDVGTTRIKAEVVGLDGRELSRAAAPTIWQRRPDGVDALPGDFLAGVKTAVAAALVDAPPGEVLGLGVTSMAETAVLVDQGGRAIGPAIAWHDHRAESDYAQMRCELTAVEIGRRTGLGSDTVPTVAVLRWLMRTQPDLRRAAKALSVAEWIVYGLGGSIAAEPSLASRTGALVITTGQWWREATDCAGLPPAIFPDLQPAGSSWGRVRAAGSGLERIDRAVLTVAGHDHLVASIGSGVTAAHQVLDSCGTAEALVRAIPADATRDISQVLSCGIATGRHVIPDHYCLLVALPLGIDLIALLERLQASQEAGRTSLDDAALAHLYATEDGAGMPPAARQWAEAVSDAVARAAAAVDRLVQVGGPITEMHVTGGWASNPVLRRLKVDAFPGVIFPHVTEAGARGAALLAGQAAGVFTSAVEFPLPHRVHAPVAAKETLGHRSVVTSR